MDTHLGTFVAEIMFMHGDADRDEIVEIPLDGYVGVEALCAFDKAWESTSRNRRSEMRIGDAESLVSMPGFGVVFGTIEIWPLDCASPAEFDPIPGRLSDYRYYKLFWYDEKGTKHPVEITEEELPWDIRLPK